MRNKFFFLLVTMTMTWIAAQASAQTIPMRVAPNHIQARKDVSTLKGARDENGPASDLYKAQATVQAYAVFIPIDQEQQATCKDLNDSSDNKSDKEKDKTDGKTNKTGKNLDNPRLQIFGPAKTVALRSVCSLDSSIYTAQQQADGLEWVNKIHNGDGYADAIAAVEAADKTKPAQVLVKNAINAAPHVPDIKCRAVYDGKEFQYPLKSFLPATRTDCGDEAVKQFFAVTKTATYGNTVQFLYAPNQGTQQYSSDLVTATFGPGFQVILAGTGTTGTTQTNTSTAPTATLAGQATAAATTSTPDPVKTAVDKLKAGGDFNLRFNYPLLNFPMGKADSLTTFVPSMGFVLSSTTTGTGQSSTSQSGINSTNEYFFYLPMESYLETPSLTGDTSNGWTNATLYTDVRFGGEVVSSDFQKLIGIKNRVFTLGQAAAGIDFAGSFRVGLQYFWGPDQAYSLVNASGQVSPVKTRIKGFHVVFSFSPGKTS